MARYDDDLDDDYDDDAHDDDADTAPGWRRWLIPGALAALALLVGFLVPYMLYLNHQVSQRFGQLQWQLPTRVYARPLRLGPGVAMDAQTLRTELDAAAYHEDSQAQRAGTFSRQGTTWRIASRGFVDVTGPVPPSRIEVVVAGGRVVSVRDLVGRRSVDAVRLDPARIATLYGQRQEERKLVQLGEVPELLVTGLQAVEDRDFARHHGIDFSGIARALWIALRSRGQSLQGGSTLTQQLARSGLLGIGKEQTVTRKFKEILYAILLEARYDKRTILETYFNQVYLGQNGAQAIHGVAAASEFWFGRELRDLKPEQIALLIGMVKGPSVYDPRRNPERARERRDFVLGKMLENGLIDRREHDRAVAAPLGVTPTPGVLLANRFPAYVELVRRQLGNDYSASSLQGAGLSVMSGMSVSAQAYAEGAVTGALRAVASRGRPPLQAGMIVTDVHSGDVLAVIGSRNFAELGFNRALNAARPVGSLLKPFVYLLAMAQPDRWSLATPVDDAPVSVRVPGSGTWTPGNSDGRSHGVVPAIDALALSYNQATVRIGMEVGPQRIVDLIATLAGIKAEARPSVILGATDQSPYAMAQLYQFLASAGRIQPLHAVRGVIDRRGNIVHRYDKTPPPAQAGDAVAARLITVALQQAVSTGTGRQLVADGLGRLQPAGKTGTSNDSRDSWFAGWTGDHLAVIWVGNDQNRPTGLYGATGAMRVWSGLFRKLPTSPLALAATGLDWQWVAGTASTDAGCPGARHLPFVAGFAPPYQACSIAPPLDPLQDPNAPEEAPADEQAGGWRSIFGLDDKPAPASDPAKRTVPANNQPVPPR